MRFIQFSIKRSSWIFLVIGLLVLTFFGCNNGNKVEQYVQKELDKDIRNDSLFLGLNFGISRKDFYDQCWKLNKQGLVKQGQENMSVRYLFRDSKDRQVEFNFYGEFEGDKVYMYNASFYYYSWAPWNRDLQSDYLLEDLTILLMEWYGGNEPFSVIVEGKKHYYKIDGNRMIDLFIMDQRFVAAKFYDLLHPKNQNILNERG